jgi:hypothetical protein
MTVTFRTIDSNGYENQYSVPHFQSWRTSKVFIPHPRAITAGSTAYLGHTREICNMAANIRNIVNANQGWTIAVWYQKGEIVNASAEPNDAGGEITSDNHLIHISYLYPTQPSCLDQMERYPRGEGAVREAGS